MKNTVILVGLALAIPILCGAQPAPAPASATQAVASTRAAALNKLMHDLQVATAQSVTNAAAAGEARRLSAELFQALAPAPADPPATGAGADVSKC